MKTVYKYFCKFEEIFCGISFISIVSLVFISAVARGLNHPIPWSIDISQLLLAWTAFLGADVAFREHNLVGIDLVTKKFPAKMQKSIELLVLILMLVALVIFIIFGVKLSIDSYKRAFQTLTLSYSFVTMSLPVASVFMSVTAVRQIVERIKTFNN